MRRLIFILTILTLVSCNNQSDTFDFSAIQYENPAILPDKSKNTFSTCFADIDTSRAGRALGCSGWTYKLINDKYVIRIFPNVAVQYDSCYTLTIDSSNAGRLTELLIFDNKDANLSNICTDLINVNIPRPKRKLHAQSGQLIVGFSDPTELYGNQTHHTTILIKKLVFIDSITGDKIELENELLWKVLDTGTPG
jgi:hypothetical protein